MPIEHWYFRATIDFTVWGPTFAKRLKEAAGSTLNDEQLGRKLLEMVREGSVEIDAISDIEAHGNSEEA